MQEEGLNVKFAPAKEGQMLWTCGYGISSQAQNVDAAYALINWYLSPKAEMFEAKTWDYTIANTRVLDVAPKCVHRGARARRPLPLRQRDTGEPAEGPAGLDAGVGRGAGLLDG